MCELFSSSVFELFDVHYPTKSIILDIISGICELSIRGIFELYEVHYPRTQVKRMILDITSGMCELSIRGIFELFEVHYPREKHDFLYDIRNVWIVIFELYEVHYPRKPPIQDWDKEIWYVLHASINRLIKDKALTSEGL